MHDYAMKVCWKADLDDDGRLGGEMADSVCRPDNGGFKTDIEIGGT